MGCLKCFIKVRQNEEKSEKWREGTGRLEGLPCLLGVEMSQSLRRQTTLQVNKQKGKKQEADHKEEKPLSALVVSQRLQPNH